MSIVYYVHLTCIYFILGPAVSPPCHPVTCLFLLPHLSALSVCLSASILAETPTHRFSMGPEAPLLLESLWIQNGKGISSFLSGSKAQDVLFVPVMLQVLSKTQSGKILPSFEATATQ